MHPLRRILIVACFGLLHALPAHAGAWPREPGKYFVSLRSDYDIGSGEFRTAIYGEYGFTRRITLGFTASDGPPDAAKQEEYEWQLENGDALLLFPPSRRRVGGFVQLAIGSLDAANRFAVSLGAAAPPDQYGVMTEHRIELAGHWGRGFSSRWGDGWTTATAKVALARDEDQPIIDLYGLVGLKPAAGWMAMVSASRFADEDGTTWKLSPSAGYQPHEKLWIVPSVTQSFGNSSESAIGLSLWLSF